jgi:NAD(P)-dependent dehydrogenase (short-subunit alcohol dehydrogenase family)
MSSSSPSSSSSFVIFGATGGLGMEIAEGLVTADGFGAKKAVVRDVSSDKAQKLQDMVDPSD